MTLNDIIVSALAQLDRGHDEQTVELYRKRLTAYANEAQSDLARTMQLTKTEYADPTDGVVDLGALSENCIRVENVMQEGHRVPFRTGDDGRLLLPYDSPAAITYRYDPKPLVSPGDVSVLNESVHPLIVSYVVGRERIGGDVTTQRGGNIYLAMYDAGKARLRGYIRDHDSFMITNRY